MAAAAVISAYVAGREWRENQNLETKIGQLQEETTLIKAKLHESETIVLEQRKRLKRSLETFAEEYRSAVKNLDKGKKGAYEQ